MNTKNVLIAALLLAAAGLWLQGHDAKVRSEATLRQRDDSLRTVVKAFNTAEAKRQTERDSLNRVLDRHVVTIRRLKGEVSTHRSALDSLTPLVLDEAPDTLKPLLARVVQTCNIIIATQDSVIQAQAYMLAVRSDQLAFSETALTQAMEIIDKTTAQKDAWRRKAEPGWLTQVGRALPKVVVGFVLGYVAAR